MSSKVCRLLLLFALLDAGLASQVIAGAAAVSPARASVHTAAQVPVRAARGDLPIGLSDRFQWLSPTDLSQSLDDAGRQLHCRGWSLVARMRAILDYVRPTGEHGPAPPEPG